MGRTSRISLLSGRSSKAMTEHVPFHGRDAERAAVAPAGGCFLARVSPRAEARLQVQNESASVVTHCLHYVDELKCASCCFPAEYMCAYAVFRCALVLAACCMPDAGLDITGVFDHCTEIPRMPSHCCESVDLLRVLEIAFITF